MSSIMITGANRGLGLEFARQYAKDDWRVFACCREPAQAEELQALASRFSEISVHDLDVSDHAQIDTLAASLSGATIDILLNNAGIYGGDEANRFGQLDYDAWLKCFQVNTLAATKMAEAFAPHIGESHKKLIVAISTLMGSIDDNGSGGSYLYRSSKTALNSAMKSLAIDLKPSGIGVLILHPGWVKTDMGGPNGEIDTPESVGGMRAVIDDFTLEYSGCFVDYQGRELAW